MFKAYLPDVLASGFQALFSNDLRPSTFIPMPFIGTTVQKRWRKRRKTSAVPLVGLELGPRFLLWKLGRKPGERNLPTTQIRCPRVPMVARRAHSRRKAFPGYFLTKATSCSLVIGKEGVY